MELKSTTIIEAKHFHHVFAYVYPVQHTGENLKYTPFDATIFANFSIFNPGKNILSDMPPKNGFKVTIYTEDYERKQNYWIIGYVIAAIVFLATHFLLELNVFEVWEKHLKIVQKLSITLFSACIILLIGKFIEKLILKNSQSEGNRYNLIRITRLLTSILIIVLAVSFLSQNYNITFGILGLASLILGFALQTPISNFIGWVYIVFRNPFQVGDRIQIGQYKGDVLRIDYLDTMMLEFSGDYLTNDRSSGRIISFPNSHVFKTEIFNYSGPFTPFIWNETAIQIAYTSDIEFVQQCLQEAAAEDFKSRYNEFNSEEHPQWNPDVYFRVNTYAWLEAVVSYPVKPRDTTTRRTGILKIALAKLNAEPGKVLFPEGTSR